MFLAIAYMSIPRSLVGALIARGIALAWSQMQLTDMRAMVLSVVLIAVTVLGCGSKDDASEATAGVSGAGNGGTAGAGASAGTGGGNAGTASTAGSSGGGGTGADGGAPVEDAGAGEQDAGAPGVGTQPHGAACANDGNCSQAMGEAVCCVNTCTLPDECSDGTAYLECETGSDCEAFGGGKICCEMGAMRFCTKQSACDGQKIP